VNTGRHFPSNQAYWILRPFLMASGVHKLDSILITKLNAAHVGAFSTLLKHVKVKSLWMPEGFRLTSAWTKYVRETWPRRRKVESVKKGDEIFFGSGTNRVIKILNVEDGAILAYQIREGERTALVITGPRRAALMALRDYGALDSDILYLPHDHTFIPEEEINVIQMISPDFIVSNQRDGQVDLKAVLSQAVEAQVININESGAIEMILQGNEWVLRTHMKPKRRGDSRFGLIPAL
jgi:hypothetical protein